MLVDIFDNAMFLNLQGFYCIPAVIEGPSTSPVEIPVEILESLWALWWLLVRWKRALIYSRSWGSTRAEPLSRASTSGAL